MRVLVVAPHPDDESIGMGGTIAKHIEDGDGVYVLFLTSGELGIPGSDPEETREIREAEATDAMARLGIVAFGFCDFPDGGLAEHHEEAVKRITITVDLYRPDRIYTTHEGENHVDHAAAARIVGQVVREWRAAGHDVEAFGFEVWTPIARPSMTVDVGNAWSTKMQAIEAHVSQDSRNYFAEAATGLGIYRGALLLHEKNGYAEAFIRLKESRMRCTILLLTWAPALDHPRAEYARRTLTAALANIDPGPDVELRVHIADDGSAEGHVEGLKMLAESLGFEVTTSISPRRGYGGNFNLAAQTVHQISDLVLALEDDWMLTRPLALTPLARALAESYRWRSEDGGRHWVRCIRLGYLGFTGELRGHVVEWADQKLLLFDPSSTEHHVFAGHARLETVDFERSIGEWPEGIGAGAVELELCGRPQSRLGVAWPLDLVHTSGDLFAHIGDVSVNPIVPGVTDADA